VSHTRHVSYQQFSDLCVHKFCTVHGRDGSWRWRVWNLGAMAFSNTPPLRLQHDFVSGEQVNIESGYRSSSTSSITQTERDVDIQYNTFTNGHRRRAELELQGGSTDGLEVAYNMSKNPLTPWRPSFGISRRDGRLARAIVYDNIVEDQLNCVGFSGWWLGRHRTRGGRQSTQG